MKINERVVFKGFHEIVEFETDIKGRIVKREQLIMKSAVAGIVIDEDNRIALVSQYRPVVQRHTKEIPAGVLDKVGLTPVETLVEELMEECEVKKEDILSVSSELFNYYTIIGHADATISVYEIHVKRQENKEVSDRDVDSVEWVTLEQMKSYLDNGQIVDGKTRNAYYHVLSNRTNMRSKIDIEELIEVLKRDKKTTQQRIKENFYSDKESAYNMIREYNHRIHTLEWVLGQHDRWD